MPDGDISPSDCCNFEMLVSLDEGVRDDIKPHVSLNMSFRERARGSRGDGQFAPEPSKLPKSWSRRSGWPEKRMIITRVTERAKGSYGRATHHPRFWSAWELARLVEGSRRGAV